MQLRGKRFSPPSTAVTLRTLPKCSVAYYVLRPCTVNASLCMPCAVGGRSVLLCSEHVNQTSYWSSGRSYVTEQWHNVPFLRTRAVSLIYIVCLVTFLSFRFRSWSSLSRFSEYIFWLWKLLSHPRINTTMHANASGYTNLSLTTLHSSYRPTPHIGVFPAP